MFTGLVDDVGTIDRVSETSAGREFVIAPAVWKKLETLRQGADIASARLWGRRAA